MPNPTALSSVGEKLAAVHSQGKQEVRLVMSMESNSAGRADHHPVGHEGPSGIWDEVDTMRFLGASMTDGCV